MIDAFAKPLGPLRRHAAALTLGGVVFGTYMIAAGRSYDYDSSETVGAFVATRSLLDPLRRQIFFNNHPLFSLLEHVVYSAGGTSETALRVLPAACGAGAVAVLTGWLGRRSLLAGVSAGLLLAAEPLFAAESRAVRGYSLLVLCAVVSSLLLVRLLERPSGRAVEIGYVVSLAAALATHLYALFVLAGHVGAVAGSGRLGRRWLLRWVAALALGGSVYIGLARTMLAASRGERGHFDADFPARAAHALLGVQPVAVVLFAALGLIGLVVLRRRGAVAATAVVLAGLLVDWAVIAPLDLWPRYLLWVVPAFAGLAGVAVARWRPIAVLAVAAIVLMGRLDAQRWLLPMLPSRPVAALVAELRTRDERVCALPFTRGALMAYVPAPPEVTRLSQLHECDALVSIATRQRGILAEARSSFPFSARWSAQTPMLVLSRTPLPEAEPRRVA